MVNKRVYVLGAGMSGLVCAYEFLKKGYQVVVYEKLKNVGGLSRTERYDAYYVDSGPHLFHTSNQEIISYWQKEFGSIFKMPSLYGQNYIDGQYFDYPLLERDLETKFPKHIFSKIQSELKHVDKKRLASAKNYSDYMLCLAGPTLKEIFFDKYPEKLWGIPTADLSANWAPQRIEIRKEKKPFHADTWAGVAKNGCGQPMEILHQKIIEMGGVIHFDAQITGFVKSNHQISGLIVNEQILSLDDNDLVVSTLPINVNANFLDIETTLTFRSVRLVNIVSTAPDLFPAESDWLYFNDSTTLFHRAGVQTRFSTLGIPEGWSIICCEIAYSKGDQISQMSDEEIEKQVILSLTNLKLLNPSSIHKVHHMDLGPVYPGYKVGYEIELQTVKSQIDKFSNFYYTGTLADFSYADFQVLTAKALDLVDLITNPGGNLNRTSKVKRKINSFNKEIQIGKRFIGLDQRPYIIGEIGLNHNGDVNIAKKLIDVCVDAGCDAAKLQTYSVGRASKTALDSKYNEDILDTEENLSQLFDRLIFNEEQLSEIFSYAKQRNMEIFSTPFDLESLDLLHGLDVPAYKIASMDIVNLPLIKSVAAKMKPIIMSTGMATLGEIEEAVASVLEVGNPNLILMHCVSSYPCAAADANLLMIPKLASTFGVVSGFSDHFPGIFLDPVAVGLGARVIEKHITLDKSMKGPDHIFSLLPHEVVQLVDECNLTFTALGSGVKTVSSSEIRSLQKLRRSLFAKVDILEGQMISPDMLTIKSPGIGILPRYIDIISGRVAKKYIAKDSPINWSDI